MTLHKNITQDIESLAVSLMVLGKGLRENEPFKFLTEKLADELQTAAAQPEDSFNQARQLIQANLSRASQLSNTMEEILTSLDRLELAHQQREKYSNDWWARTLGSLYHAFKQDPALGFQQWITFYGQALIDWNLETCDRLTSTLFDFSDDHLPYVLLIRHGQTALQEKTYPSTLQMLDYLIDYLQKSPNADPEQMVVMLLIFMGRIQQVEMNDSEGAHRSFQKAIALAPHDGRPLAAMGQLALSAEKGVWAESNKLFTQAIDLSPDQPDGYVGKAMLAEAREQWSEADDWYKNAIEEALDEIDLLNFLSKFLAPGSGRLYYHIACQLAEQDPAKALAALDLCIDKEFQDGTSYPERAAKALKAEIFSRLAGPTPLPEDAQKTAALYFTAGEDYTGNNEYRQAVDLYRKGRSLDPKNATLVFTLADILRVSTQVDRLPYYSSEGEVRESLALWEEAFTLLPEIDQTTAWVFTARARISQQLAHLPGEDTNSHSWQAIAYTEQSLILDDNPDYWPTLSSGFNDLSLDANMLYVMHKIEKNGQASIYSKEERSRAYANIGQFKQATKVLNSLIKEKSVPAVSKILYKSWLAMVNYYLGEYQEGLENLESSLKSDSENMWPLCLKANIYHMMGNEKEARQIDQWVWDQKEVEKYKDFITSFDWTGFRLGLFAEILGRLENRLNSPYQEDYFESHLLTGLCYLAQNEIQTAEPHLTMALQRVINLRQISDFLLELDLLQQRARLENWPHAKKLSAYLNQSGGFISQGISVKKIIGATKGNPIKELQRVLADPVLGLPGSWSWLAAQASLGRLYLEANQVDNARDVYQKLIQYPDKMKGARAGIALVNKKAQS